jgi:Inner membrane component of T3SS, cytoplasmic domain
LVRLEMRHGASRPSAHDVAGEEFIIGSVAGCDLRLPGTNLPPIIAQIVRRADGVRIRKLAPTQPVFLNGQPVVTQATLAHGDLLQIGQVELHVQLALPEASALRHAEPPPAVSFVPLPSSPSLAAQPLAGASANVWQQYQQEVTQFREQQRQLEEQARELESDRAIWYRRRDEIDREIQQQKLDLERERQAAAAIQQQSQAEARQVQEMRLQLQNREKQLETELHEFTARVQSFQPRLAELTVREQAIAGREAQAAKTSADSQVAQQMQSQYQADLVRLDRLQVMLATKQQEVDSKSQEIDKRYAQMQRDAQEMEEQARLLDGGQVRLKEEAERLTRQKSEQEALGAQLLERASMLESQQAMLAAIRGKMDRLKEELRQQAQQLAEERARNDDIAGQLKHRLQLAEKLQNELDAENKERELERASHAERNAVLHEALTRIKDLQNQLNAKEAELKDRESKLEAQAAEQAEQTGLLRARAQQLVELQLRIEADRQSIRERETALTQAEEARKALQEQLLRRSEELAARARSIDEQAQGLGGKEADLARARMQAEQQRHAVQEQFEQLKADLDTRAAEIHRLNAALTQREDNVRRQVERLKEAGLQIASERKLAFATRTRWESDQSGIAEQMAKARADLETFRAETLRQANELGRALPELELRCQGAIDRLAQSREQLRGHLNELHSYARQSQEDLQELRAQIQAETDRLRQQELALHRARSEHRLAVTAFRQQIIDWQGRVGDMKHLFAQNESRLDLKQQALEAAAKEMDESSRQLAKQAETLHQQQREVAERKTEVEGHLGEMREWYRSKLRDLAGGAPPRRYSGEILEMPKANVVNDLTEDQAGRADQASQGDYSLGNGGRDILSLTGDVDPADRKLGELLLQLGLVDQEMLMPLWNEARRQRRSLRQVLLSSGTVTLYQMALIEAGNVAGLVLGPYRVIDRVQSSPREVLYRVFDPSRSTVALLRHLVEAEMSDAARVEEYRQRFGAAVKVTHPNLAATYEVLEINGRPAALQEWVNGIASPDWPALAAVPGVWFRLIGQAALGLQAAHAGGLIHGHLSVHSTVLTADGTLKLVGLGEPAWLTGGTEPGNGVEADLQALGRAAAEWSMLAPRVKRSKPKPLPESLQNVIRGLGAAAFGGLDRKDQPIMLPPFDENRLLTATELLTELDAIGADLPPNSEAWDRLIKHVGENATEGAALKRTA